MTSRRHHQPPIGISATERAYVGIDVGEKTLAAVVLAGAPGEAVAVGSEGKLRGYWRHLHKTTQLLNETPGVPANAETAILASEWHGCANTRKMSSTTSWTWSNSIHVQSSSARSSTPLRQSLDVTATARNSEHGCSPRSSKRGRGRQIAKQAFLPPISVLWNPPTQPDGGPQSLLVVTRRGCNPNTPYVCKYITIYFGRCFYYL